VFDNTAPWPSALWRHGSESYHRICTRRRLCAGEPRERPGRRDLKAAQ
jgi:hypothetical protein